MTEFENKLVNPILRKTLEQEELGENCITYKSVFTKVGFFLMLVIVGIAGAFVLNAITTPVIIDGAEFLSISTAEIIAFALAVVLSFIFSIVASFSKSFAGIFGSISCLCYGYILGFMAVAMPEYRGPMLFALVLTISVVIVLTIIYRSGLVKVDNRFRKMIYVLFFTMVIASLLMFICYFIPGIREAVIWFTKNSIISIVFGIIGVVIASMFLLCDFDSVQKAVENKMDKSYENLLAFGLAFSVIWLYFKILSLIIRIMERNK